LGKFNTAPPYRTSYLELELSLCHCGGLDLSKNRLKIWHIKKTDNKYGISKKHNKYGISKKQIKNMASLTTKPLSKMDQIVKILDSITISSALHSEDAN
jgi:hypothetical protein